MKYIHKSSEVLNSQNLSFITRVGYILVYERILINRRIYYGNRVFCLKQDKLIYLYMYTCLHNMTAVCLTHVCVKKI